MLGIYAFRLHPIWVLYVIRVFLRLTSLEIMMMMMMMNNNYNNNIWDVNASFFAKLPEMPARMSAV